MSVRERFTEAFITFKKISIMLFLGLQARFRCNVPVHLFQRDYFIFPQLGIISTFHLNIFLLADLTYVMYKKFTPYFLVLLNNRSFSIK